MDRSHDNSTVIARRTSLNISTIKLFHKELELKIQNCFLEMLNVLFGKKFFIVPLTLVKQCKQRNWNTCF